MSSFTSLFKAGSSEENLTFQRLFWGTLAGCLVAIVLAESSWLKMMELSTLEWRYKVARYFDDINPLKTTSRDIAVIAFDDSAQFDLGIARFSDVKAQDYLAKTIDKVEEGKPSLVAINLDLRGASSKELVRSFRQGRNVVVALYGSLDGASALPSGELIGHSAAYGYNELVKEVNGVVCRLPINYMRRSKKAEKDFMPVKSFTEAIIDVQRRFQGVGPASEFLSVQSDQPLYIRFKPTNYQTISMRDVLQSDFNAKALANKIVLVGSTLTARSNDPQNFRTPTNDSVPEVFIQADALSSLLNNEVIYSLPRFVIHLCLVLLGAAFGAMASVVSMGKRFLYIVLAAVLLVLLAQISFQWFNLALPVAPPAAVLFVVFVLGTFIYLDTDLRRRNFELAQARKTMQVRAEEERRRIAEDLHDETLPTLSTVARMADQLTSQLPENPVPGMMRQKLDAAVSEMRRVINDLHPSVIETMGFVPALENLVTILARNSGIQGKFVDTSSQDNNSDYPISDFTKLQLYRIVQEAVNNIEKHSQADKAEVQIGRIGDSLVVCVIDNGIGFDGLNQKRQSFGLVNIRQRAQLIGAHVEWQKPQSFEKGTQVRIELPLISN